MSFLNDHFPEVNAAGNTLYRALRLYYANGSAKAWGTLLSRIGRRLAGKRAPAFITIATTYRCQCRCVHCYADGRQTKDRPEMTTSQIKSVIDDAKKLGVYEVIFSGGEPLLREDIAELVRHAHDQGLLTRVNTNGGLLTREMARRLKQARLTQCGVSIDVADAATHDQLRGLPGLYEKAVEGIGHLRESGVLCQILTYAARENVTEGLERVIDLGRRLGVLAVYIFFPIAAGRWDSAFELMLTDDERARVRQLQDLRFVHLELATPRSLCCVLSRSIIYVSAHGDVTPCPFVPYILGNICQDTLGDVWQRHCARPAEMFRGECPLNDAGARWALQQHAEAVRAQGKG